MLADWFAWIRAASELGIGAASEADDHVLNQFFRVQRLAGSERRARGFTLAALKMLHMTRPQAEGFYAVHRDRPFYPGLVEFMSSGPVIVMVLRHEDAVEEFRRLIGTTDPAKAAPGTIRADFGTDVRMNAVHGSDSPENAIKEASFFFSDIEMF